MKKYYCIDCNKEVSDYRVKRCRKCADIQHSINIRGSHNPAWRGGLPKCKCGKILTDKKYKKYIFCYIKYMKSNPYNKGIKKSKEWRNRISETMKKKGITKDKNNPMFGKVTHPKYIKYKNIYFHSSWELRFYKWCLKNKIKVLYESKTFNLGNCTYTPDFYLPEFNLYIEIKGYWRNDAKKKFKEFQKRYCGERIKLIKQKELIDNKII